jgi:DNA (cytosine-5)-methyltransferase 1
VEGIWASPPCQPYSRAGKKLGAKDERDAWPETLAAIDRFRPGWVVVENVLGAPSESWARQIATLGYRTAVWELDAADFGVPQHRHRRFVVAVLEGRRLPPPPFPTVRYGWRSMGEALPHLEPEARAAWAKLVEVRLPGGMENGYYLPVAQHPAWWHRASPVDEPSRTIGSRGNACVDVNVGAGSKPELLERPAPTVTAQEYKGTRASSSGGWKFHGGPDRASDAAFLAVGRRRLTVAECAWLQGFPEGYRFTGTKEEQYRQVGNSCPAALVEAVVRGLVQP